MRWHVCLINSNERRLDSFSNLILGAQASGAQIQPFRSAIYHNGSRLDVGYPVAVGVALGMTDPMTEL